MSQNVEIVREQFEATNRRDFTTVMDLYHEDVELVVGASVNPTNSGTFCGREAVGSWFGDWFRSFGADYRFEIEEARAVGERVFVVARHQGRERTSGAVLDWSTANVYTIQADKIVRVELYRDRTEALKAVGRSE
jgi:ketosteroid isomerase-like protein